MRYEFSDTNYRKCSYNFALDFIFIFFHILKLQSAAKKKKKCGDAYNVSNHIKTAKYFKSLYTIVSLFSVLCIYLLRARMQLTKQYNNEVNEAIQLAIVCNNAINEMMYLMKNEMIKKCRKQQNV